MHRIFFSILTLSFVLIVASLASAQQNFNHNNDFAIENLCDPDAFQELGQQPVISGLNFDQLEKVRIELLERGFNPGFGPDRDDTIDAELMQALVQFQAEYELPVTGNIDVPTLLALSFPIEQIQVQNF